MKSKTALIRLTVSCLAGMTLLSGCGSGFEAASKGIASCSPSCNTSAGAGGAGDSTDPGKVPSGTNEASEAWKSLEVDGAVNGGLADRRQVLAIDKVNKELIVRLPIVGGVILGGAMAEIPLQQLPGARLALESSTDGTSALALRIPLRYVLYGVDFLPPSRLPNGDKLPQIPSGELPSFAIQLSQLTNSRATVYLAPSVVGLYVSIPLIIVPIQVTVPIRNQARTRTFGYFTVVPEKKGVADGGVFISIALPDDLARIIDDNL